MFKTVIFSILLAVAFCFAGQSAKVYKDYQLQSLRVPIGGISTGDILMGGRGNIAHVEIFNRPDRQRRLEKTGFALWVQQADKKPVAKLLEREIFPPYTESTHVYVNGLPRMRQAEFINNFPLHQWNFSDPDIPLDISMQAFSPFIPLDVDKSSYPAVVFYWDFYNNSDEPVKASIVMNMENPVKGSEILNTFVDESDFHGIRFSAQETDDPNMRGGLLMGTPIQNTQIQTHWYPGQWRDETHIFWVDFSGDGSIAAELEEWQTSDRPSSYNRCSNRMASVLVQFELQQGEKIRIPFYLAWYFPNRQYTPAEVFGKQQALEKICKNAYADLFSSEIDVYEKFRKNEPELYELTEKFARALYSPGLPPVVHEALATQAASLRSPLIQVTQNGQVHGFEGVLPNGWCCPGTCTHVWNYEQALAMLFPSLERKMREIEFLHDTFENGFQTHRSVVPLGEYWFDGPAAADGQMGTIVRAYREWKLSGDDKWLAKLWPKIQKALEFAWTGPGKVDDPDLVHQESQTAWDPDKTGILDGRQHNTYDINFFGPSSMTTSIYLAGLKAASEMAAAMGDDAKSQEYFAVFKKGAQTAEQMLWNGEYFVQIIPEQHQDQQHEEFQNTAHENGVKYQYGDGCLSDQLLGQYLAFNAGLGYIMDDNMVRGAIKQIYDNNFISPLRNIANVQRVYGLNDEAGVVLCTWPHNNRPALPFVYSDEIWSGVEYQVAASLIYAGYIDEGLEIVKAVDDRHDGFKRNPFEHDESGVHYARAMASWSLLPALSGFEWDGRTQSLAFSPKINADEFSTFWSTNSAWGRLQINSDQVILSVDYGELELTQLTVSGTILKSCQAIQKIAAGEKLILKK